MAWSGRLLGHRFAGSAAWWHLPVYDPGEFAIDPINNRADRDGYTLRPVRFHVKHAPDGARQAELAGIDLLPIDRREGRSVRAGRLPNDGRVHRFSAWGARAGEGFGIRRMVVRYETSAREGRLFADTTARTDRDGYSLYVPSCGLRTAPDSSRNADLGDRSVDRDRFGAGFLPDPDKGDGMVHRLLLDGGGRAGTALGIRRIVVRYAVVPRAGRLSTDTTSRTDRDGYSLHVPTVAVRAAADSALDADLGTPAADRDRFDTMHGVNLAGAVHRVRATGDGRAGTALAIRRMRIEYAVVPEDRREATT